MIRITRTAPAVLALALLTLSCDEGRLVTDVEGRLLPPTVDPLAGAAALLVGEQTTYGTAVRLGDATVTQNVLRWSASPAGVLVFDSTHRGPTLDVTAGAPGVATLRAVTSHPHLDTVQVQRSVTVSLDHFVVVAPAARDTLLTAIGDEMLVRVRGAGHQGALVDSAGVDWTHRGTALTLLGAATLRDTLRVRAQAVGVDTLVFRQNASLCTGTPCVDTIYVRVQQVPASVTVDTLRLATLGREGVLSATVRDARANAIPSADVTWSLVDPADTVVIALDGAGNVTALGNGTVAVTATAGTVEGSGAVVVRQAIHGVAVPEAVDLDGPGATESVVAMVTDSAGSAVSRPFEVEWTSRAPGVAAVAPAEAGSPSATITATGAGVTRVVASVEGAQDSVTVTVTQELTAVVIEPASLTLNYVGATRELAASARDAQGNVMPGFEATWTSLAPGIATVDAAGQVTAVAVGTAGIVAEMEGVADTVDVEVRQIARTLAILPNPVEDTLFHGETVQLSLVAVDTGEVAIPSPEADWSAEPAEIATVSAEGLVTALDVAQLESVWIRAVAGDGVDSVLIRVDVAILTSVTVEPSLDTIRALTATRQLTATALNQRGNPIPGEAFGWASRDEDVATVHALTGLVTAAGDGSTYIVATSNADPAIQDSALVVVEQTAAAVTVHPASHTFAALGQTREFVARAVDSEGEPVPGAVFDWVAAPSGPVTLAVTSDSTVTATAAANGSATLTATETASGVEEEAEVTVQQVALSVDVDPAAAVIVVDSALTLRATVRDANGHPIPGVAIDWTLADPVIVDTAGAAADSIVVTGLTIGSTEVTASGAGVSNAAAVEVVAYSLAFDGNDFAEVANDAAVNVAGRANWTIELWVRPGANAGDEDLLNKGGTGTAVSYRVILRQGRPVLITRQGVGPQADRTTTFDVGTDLAQDEWHHVAFTYASGTVQLIVNGSVVGSGTVNAPQEHTGALFIGAASASAGFFTGHLDEVRYWSVTRTAEAIAETMGSRLTLPQTGLLAYWPFEEGAGDPVGRVVPLTALLGGGTEANRPAWSTESPFNP